LFATIVLPELPRVLPEQSCRWAALLARSGRINCMTRKAKPLILLSVAAGLLVTLGVTLLVQSPSKRAEEATPVWRHFYNEAKMEAIKDTNGVWWYRAVTNNQQASQKPAP